MADTEADDTYSDALRREIMRSEQQRMRVIVIILAMVLAAVMIVLNFIPEIDERLFDKKVPGWVPLAGIGPYLLYELATLSILRWRSAKGKDFPRIARFGNALIETSLPASITYVLSGYMQPQLVFAFWPPLLFFVFILLSTLRLDFWLSVWTGTVAAVPICSASMSRPRSSNDFWPRKPNRRASCAPSACSSSIFAASRR
jgi:adenylate cyclase